jgi:hypothetical protein
MIRVVHPGSGCRLSSHPGSRIQGSKRHRIRIRNTGQQALLSKVADHVPHGSALFLEARSGCALKSKFKGFEAHTERRKGKRELRNLDILTARGGGLSESVPISVGLFQFLRTLCQLAYLAKLFSRPFKLFFGTGPLCQSRWWTSRGHPLLSGAGQQAL